jgi:hypothetical protein
VKTIEQCLCHHEAEWLAAEITAGRYPQEYRDTANGYVLVCRKCEGLWDHRATDRVIEHVMSGQHRAGIDAAPPSPEPTRLCRVG